MNHCDKCKVDVENGIHHCPLCGRSIDDTPKALKATRYPDYAEFYKHRLHLTTLLAKILIVLSLACVVIDLIFTFGQFWSTYVVAGAFLVLVGVLLPIRYRMSLSMQVKFQIFGLAVVIVILEIFTKTFGWGVGYVLPFVLGLYSIITLVMLFVKGYINFDFFLPMCFIAFCSILLYVLNKFVFHLVLWPVLIPLIISCVSIAMLFVFRFNRTLKCIKKHWKI